MRGAVPYAGEVGATLSLIGAWLEVVGLAIAILGAWQTWKSVAETGEYPWTAVVVAIRASVRSAATAIESRIRRMLGKPKPVIVNPGAVSIKGQAFPARAIIGYGPLAADFAAALKQLDERTRELLGAIASERHEREQAIADVGSAVSEAAERAAADLRKWQASYRKATIEGLKTQFLGYPIVFVGPALQALSRLGSNGW